MRLKNSLNPHLLGVRHFVSKYRYSVGSIVAILILWVAAAQIIFGTMSNQIQQKEAAYQKESEETMKHLEKLTAERKAKQEAEEKRIADEKAKEEAQGDTEGGVSTGTDAGSQGGNTASCNTSSTNNNPNSVDVVVNKKHCLTPLTFAPADLVTSNGATLSAKAIDSFNQMFADAANDGQPFMVSSSYRSYDTQVSTYNYWVSINGQQNADTVSARPGFSEHQTGFAVDIGANGCILDCFGSTSQYQWLQANAHKYGFIQRYYSGFESITGYSSEEWHYRYVGKDIAEDMRLRNSKTLEQYFGLEGGDYR